LDRLGGFNAELITALESGLYRVVAEAELRWLSAASMSAEVLAVSTLHKML
jgi:hypothetical protein